MEKNTIIKTVVVVIVAVLASVAMIITNQNKGKKEVEITMSINAGIPYKWEYKIKDTSIVEFVKDYVVEDKNNDNMVGAEVSTNYVFKGLKEGKTDVVFKEVSLDGTDVVKEETYTLKVDKNKNISIVSE